MLQHLLFFLRLYIVKRPMEFAANRDDDRSDCAFRAWGSRRVSSSAARPGSGSSYHQPGVVNPRSVTTTSRLPATSVEVDSIFREPKRAAGSWSFTKPFFQQYEYYKTYGNAGCHALSSHHHNFPVGDVPVPSRVYSAEPQSRVTKVRNPAPRQYQSIGTSPNYSVPSPLYPPPRVAATGTRTSKAVFASTE